MKMLLLKITHCKGDLKSLCCGSSSWSSCYWPFSSEKTRPWDICATV